MRGKGSEVTFQTDHKITRFCPPDGRGVPLIVLSAGDSSKRIQINFLCGSGVLINLRASTQDDSGMIDFATLAVFSGAVLLLLLSPGPNMAFVISHGISHGWRGGLAASLGIGVADIVLTVLTATGVTAVVAGWPPSFDLIRYAGVGYLLWLAFKTVQKRPDHAVAAVEPVALKRVFLHAMLNSLLNPKALLFFVVFLPQFVRPEAGAIAGQLLLLGGVLTLIAAIFHGVLGISGGAIRRCFSGRPGSAVLQRWGLATVLTALAVRLALMSRPV